MTAKDREKIERLKEQERDRANALRRKVARMLTEGVMMDDVREEFDELCTHEDNVSLYSALLMMAKDGYFNEP